MIKAAIVEDQAEDFEKLQTYLRDYGNENGISFEIVRFSNGLNFIEEYRPEYDLIFMDIEMPHLNGLDAARRLREIDEDVALIFVTNMLQYAINGYEVDAIDFMVKPVTYFNFSRKLKKALKLIGRNEGKTIVVHSEDRTQVMPVSEIYYIEKDKNYLLIHSAKGEFRERGTISELAEELSEFGFSRCFSSCLVNLKYVTSLEKDRLIVEGDILPISRRQKKEFMMDFAKYFGGGA